MHHDTQIKRVLIAAGGTGGHIFPALAVAKQLQAKGASVHWLGTRQGLESQLVKKENIPLRFINIKGVRGTSLLNWLAAPWRIFYSICQVIAVYRELKPDLVLGMGGFVSGPAGVGAWLLGIPLVIHEQNAVAGTTNKLLARLASTVLESFPDSFPTSINTILTGNPIRDDFNAFTKQQLEHNSGQPAEHNTLRVLVLGGSRGARKLNQAILSVLGSWQSATPITIWHQTGSLDHITVQQQYNNLTLNSKQGVSIKAVAPFIQDMPAAYRWADVVLCRAGAITVAELAAAGAVSILVPYPFAIDDHQTKNAQYLTQAGAGILLPEHHITTDKLTELLLELAASPHKRSNMAAKAYKLANFSATAKVAQYCLQCV